MIIRRDALRKELVSTLQQINKQIAEVERQAQRLATEPHILRDASGGWIMTPLLTAKAQTLYGLALLNDKE